MLLSSFKRNTLISVVGLLFCINTVAAQPACTPEVEPNESCPGTNVSLKCASGTSNIGEADYFTKTLKPGKWIVRYRQGGGQLTVFVPGKDPKVSASGKVNFNVPSTDTPVCVLVDLAQGEYEIEFKRNKKGGGVDKPKPTPKPTPNNGGKGGKGGKGKGGKGGGKKKACKAKKLKLPKASACRGKKGKTAGCEHELTWFFNQGSADIKEGAYTLITGQVDFTNRGYESRLSGRILNAEDPSNEPATFFCQSNRKPNKNQAYQCYGRIEFVAKRKKRNICCKVNYTELPGSSMTFKLDCGREDFTLSGPLSPAEDAFKDFNGDGNTNRNDYEILSRCVDGLEPKNGGSCQEGDLDEDGAITVEDLDIFLPTSFDFD